MSVNNYEPHVLVLPEDGANRQLANGFCRVLDWRIGTRIQVLPEAGGWLKAIEKFNSDYATHMACFEQAYMVLLIDCDDREDRIVTATSRIPAHLRERVFILGARGEPEELRQDKKLRQDGVRTYEEIGSALAQDCRDGTSKTWSHKLLCNNEEELERMRDTVRPILFHSER
jgi:hypothetical protein